MKRKRESWEPAIPPDQERAIVIAVAIVFALIGAALFASMLIWPAY